MQFLANEDVPQAFVVYVLPVMTLPASLKTLRARRMNPSYHGLTQNNASY